MTIAIHGQQTTSEGIHVPFNWSLADATARAALSGLVATDVGKLALQADDNSLWMLTATTPTWVFVGGGASGLGTFTSAQLAAALSDETGTGLAVFGTLPTFTTAIKSPAMRPSADSTTALQLQNAAGTAVVTVDTTNGRVGIGTNAPASLLHVEGDLIVSEPLVSAPTIEFKETTGPTSWYFNIEAGPIFNIKATGVNYAISIPPTGRVGIKNTLPTALLHIGAGTATASTAPLKFTSGVNLTTPEAGAMEYNGRFSLTETAGTRRFVVQAVASTKTTAAAPYTNDGYVTVTINGTDVRLMTTA